MCEYSWFTTTFSSTSERKLRLETGRQFFMLSFFRVGFFNRGETRTDLKCERKEPSESDKFIIDVIGVIRMSMQSFTELVGIGSKSDDLHRASKPRWCTSPEVTQVRFYKTFMVSRGFSARKCELEGRDE